MVLYCHVSSRLKIDRTVPEVAWCVPGEVAAHEVLRAFTSRLPKYSKERNDPSLPGERCSGVRNCESLVVAAADFVITSSCFVFRQLSPYFHFGQLAPQRAALEVAKASLKSRLVLMEIRLEKLSSRIHWLLAVLSCVAPTVTIQVF